MKYVFLSELSLMRHASTTVHCQETQLKAASVVRIQALIVGKHMLVFQNG